MNRRELLGGLGTTVSLGLLSTVAADSRHPLVVRVWTSERAAQYDSLRDTVATLLESELDETVGPVLVEFGDDPIALPSEDSRSVLANRWPQMVAEGAAGIRSLDPVGGINLLVTDGDPTNQPSGFARPQIAATTGAAQIASVTLPDDLSEPVKYTVETAAAQLLLHECGHALGLTHDHGSTEVTANRVVVSPMLSSYIWKNPAVRNAHLSSGGNVCGGQYPPSDVAGERYLRLQFGDCAAQALERRSRS